MADPALRPAAVAALTRRRWAAIGLVLGGLAVAVGMSVLLVLVATKSDGAGGGVGGGPGAVVLMGAWMFWQGAVVYRRDVRALGGNGERVALRPVFASELKGPTLTASSREVRVAWLVADRPEASCDLAIPVSPEIADRARGGTAAIVRGRFQLGERVVLDFPKEVVFTSGPVEAIPHGVPERADHFETKRMSRSRRQRHATSIALRLTGGTLLLLLAALLFTEGVGVDGRDCGSVPNALADAVHDGCSRQGLLQGATGLGFLIGGAAVAVSGVRRLTSGR